jgi:hypothetical protein
MPTPTPSLNSTAIYMEDSQNSEVKLELIGHTLENLNYLGALVSGPTVPADSPNAQWVEGRITLRSKTIPSYIQGVFNRKALQDAIIKNLNAQGRAMAGGTLTTTVYIADSDTKQGPVPEKHAGPSKLEFTYKNI